MKDFKVGLVPLAVGVSCYLTGLVTLVAWRAFDFGLFTGLQSPPFWWGAALLIAGVASTAMAFRRAPAQANPSRPPGKAEPPQLPSAPPREALPVTRFRVVGAHGVCPRGHALMGTFTLTATGEISPPLCPPAAAALGPILAAMARGDADAPEHVCCPIYDHMLVLQLDDTAGERNSSPGADPSLETA